MDASTAGYSLTRNFFSDLGMTIAYNGQANRIGAILFVVALMLLIVGMGSMVGFTVLFLTSDTSSRLWARLATASLVAVCVAFAGVAFTPENRAMGLHVGFTQWAWRISPAVALLLGVASKRNARLRRRAAVAWFSTACFLGVYAVLLSRGPSVNHPDGLVVQVIAQKAASVVVIAAVLVAVHEVDRVGAVVRPAAAHRNHR